MGGYWLLSDKTCLNVIFLSRICGSTIKSPRSKRISKLIYKELNFLFFQDDDEIDVTLTYLVHLEIVTVQGKVILKDPAASADILEVSVS